MELMDRDSWPLAPDLKAEPLEGAEVFVAATRMALDSARTVHHGHTHEITFPGPTQAHVFLILRDYIEWSPEPHTAARRGMRGFGIYDEDFRKLDGEWKISGWRLTYIRTDPLRRAPLPGPPIGGPEDEQNMARVRAAYAEYHRRDSGTPAGSADLQQLVDREAIKELKARYYRFADAGEWGALRELFTDDLEVDLAPGQQFHTADEYVSAARELVGSGVTVHQGHMPQITIVSPEQARGTWMLGVYVEWPSGSPDGERTGARAYGYQRETYRKLGGEWKIARLHQSQLRIDALPLQPLANIETGS
jgi:hypothetical protein